MSLCILNTAFSAQNNVFVHRSLQFWNVNKRSILFRELTFLYILCLQFITKWNIHFLLPLQHDDVLDVRRVGEHVDGLDAADAVMVLSEQFEVAGLRGGVAGHVDDALWGST